MTLLDDLTATHWHVSRAARDGVPPHRRLEIAAMSKSNQPDIAAVVARLTEIGAHDEAATVTALATGLDALRLLAPQRDWWAEIAAIVGRGCVTLPDVAVAVREVVERKDAEIARLRAAASTVGALLATAPVIEYRVDLGRGPRWRQARHGFKRTWLGRTSPGVGMEWTEWTAGSDDVDDHLARLVPASEADADPNTRGPIGGAP